MKVILEEEKEGIAILKLNNGVTNSIDMDFIGDFEANLNIVEKNYRGLIIRGNEKFFSMGFNLPELLNLDKKFFEKFYIHFNELILKLYTISIPTLSVIEGHAVAGGFIIAIATDYRLAVPDKKLGLNEINLGVPAPFLSIKLLERLSYERSSVNLLYNGNLIKTQDALKYQIVDEIVSLEDIHSKSLEIIINLSKKPLLAFKNTKKFLTENIRDQYYKFKEFDKEKFLECWYSEEAQNILKETAKKF